MAAGGRRLLAKVDGLGVIATAERGLREEVQQERIGIDDALRRVAERRRDVDRSGVTFGHLQGNQAHIDDHGLALVAGAEESSRAVSRSLLVSWIPARARA